MANCLKIGVKTTVSFDIGMAYIMTTLRGLATKGTLFGHGILHNKIGATPDKIDKICSRSTLMHNADEKKYAFLLQSASKN